MLQYLYKDDYRVPDLTKRVATEHERSRVVRCRTQPPLLHVKVYHLAEGYGLARLRLLALEKFKTSSGELWHTKGFLEAAREAYTVRQALDQDLCNVVIGIFVTHLEPLLRREKTGALEEGGEGALLWEEGASTLLLDVPALALHLLKFPTPWS